jgi:hypothetical protein
MASITCIKEFLNSYSTDYVESIIKRKIKHDERKVHFSFWTDIISEAKKDGVKPSQRKGVKQQRVTKFASDQVHLVLKYE